MMVIAKDVEEKLLADLRTCLQDGALQRCFYVAFSKTEVPRKELFENLLRLLQDVPDSYKAQVYICQDRDIFILMQGFMQRQFADFLKTLGDDLKVENLLKLAEVIEVRVHWDKLEAMCHRKIEKIQQEMTRETEEKRKEVAEKETLEVLTRLDPEKIASIEKRRENRADPMVMVVDDDQISRTLVGNVVREDFGWSYAKDGKGALTEYVESAPDVLFLDIGLPDINGHDVLECIFQIDPSAYIIMFSGRKDKQNIIKALESGAQGFVGKPFTREKIFQYIDRSPHLLHKRQKDGGRAYTAR